MSEYIAHTEVIDGWKIEVHQDENYDYFDDNEGLKLISFHRDIGSINNDGYKSPEEVVEAAKDVAWLFPVKAYIHSGVSLSLSGKGYPFDCPWDSCWCAYLWVDKTEYWDTKEKAEAAAQSLIQELNDLYSGNVWGFIIFSPEGEEVDSCWGYIGDWENMIDEPRGNVRHYIKERQKKMGLKLKDLIKSHVPFALREDILKGVK